MIIFILIAHHLINSLFAIQCNHLRHRRNGDDRSLANCTGDYCYTLTVAFEIGYDQGCVAGIIMPTECWTDLSGTLCVCNTSFCNTPELQVFGLEIPRIECFKKEGRYSFWNETVEYSSELPENETLTGYVCDAMGKFDFWGLATAERKSLNGTLYHGEQGRQAGAFRIITGMLRSSSGTITRLGELSLYYYGGFYRHDFGDEISFFGRCNTPLCNTWEPDSIDRKGVVCKARSFWSRLPIEQTQLSCEGQMCGISVVHTEYPDIDTVSYFCFSQNSILAEYPMMVGYYSDIEVMYFHQQYYYLCAEDYCNTNVSTAMASIAKYKKQHKDEYPPKKNPLYVYSSTSNSIFSFYFVLMCFICVTRNVCIILWAADNL